MKDLRFVRDNSGSNGNLLRLSIFAATMFFLLLMRLLYLQIIEAENYQDMSESNRLRLVPVAASRGTIFDRNGKVIVGNHPSFSVTVIPQEIKDKDVLIERLSRCLGVDRAELLEKWEKGKGRAKYFPITLASAITRDQLEIVEENRLNLPGVSQCTSMFGTLRCTLRRISFPPARPARSANSFAAAAPAAPE